MQCAWVRKATRSRVQAGETALKLRVPNGTAKGAFLCIHYVPILIMQFRKPKPRMALLGSRSGSIKGMYRRNIVCPRQTECPMRSARGACLQQSAVEDAAVRAGESSLVLGAPSSGA